MFGNTELFRETTRCWMKFTRIGFGVPSSGSEDRISWRELGKGSLWERVQPENRRLRICDSKG